MTDLAVPPASPAPALEADQLAFVRARMCGRLLGQRTSHVGALHANLEAGVLINDPAMAGSLERHVRQLMEQGALVGE